MESFKYALRGLRVAWTEEPSFRFEISWAIATLLLSAAFRISLTEFLIVLFMIGFVLCAEALNTALEELCDKFQPTEDPHVAKIKDLAAAAVLIAAITALIVGCVIFIPYVIEFLAL